MTRSVITMITLVALAAVIVPCATQFGYEMSGNLLGNYDFDETLPNSGSDTWFKNGNNKMNAGTTSTGCYSGDSCGYALARTVSWCKLAVRVPVSSLDAESDYWVSLFVKVTEDKRSNSGALFNSPLIRRVRFTNGADQYYGEASIPHNKADSRWKFLGADFKTPDAATLATWQYIEFYVDMPTSVGYMLDASALVKISEPDWRTTAQENIELYRKADLDLRVVTNSPLDYDLVQVDITPKERFPFGSMVYADKMSDWNLGTSAADQAIKADNALYRTWFSDVFDWAVFNHRAKWRQMENNEPDYTDNKFAGVDAAMDVLEDMGTNVRGHCLHWNYKQYQPNYIQAITNNQTYFREEVDRRVDYMTDHYLDKFAHYDVVNEAADQIYLEQQTGNPDMFLDIHRRTRQNDPDTELFTNDFGNIENTYRLTGTINNALYLDENNLIDGIGIQAHFGFSYSNDLDPETSFEVIKRRLDAICQVGVPVWITEMDSDLSDLDDETAFFEDMLLMFFGNPKVEGILFWGVEQFLDEDQNSNTLGTAVKNLIDGWRSSPFSVSPSSAHFQASYPGLYLGTYGVTITYDGDIILEDEFELKRGEVKQLELVVVANS